MTAQCRREADRARALHRPGGIAARHEDEDEFYLADLVGLEVRDETGAKTGTVSAVHNFGAGDILEIRPLFGAGLHGAVHKGGRAGRRYRRRLPRLRAAAGSLGARGRMTGFRASVITLYPEMFPGPLGVSLAGKALEAGSWSLETVALREFGVGRHRMVDDTPAGGGAGMVLRADVLAAAIDSASPAGDPRPRLLMSPRGRLLDQAFVRELAAGSGRGHCLRAVRGRRRAGDRGARARRSFHRRLCAFGR